MISKTVYRNVAIALVVSMLVQVSPWGYPTVISATFRRSLLEEQFLSMIEALTTGGEQESAGLHPASAPLADDCLPLYVPVAPQPDPSTPASAIHSPDSPGALSGPQIDITQPREGWTISGMTWFAAQPFDPSQVSSVNFKAGTTDLGTDTTPEDGFRVFLDASTLPDGPVELIATATNPCGETTKVVNVNVVANPGQNTIVTTNGGVVASEIGSLITIQPGGAPEGTTVSITEKTQEEITVENGFDWDAMGVTFLGAQVITSSNPFSLPVTVASAGFGPRVQPGQVVVNYNIVPDADGDGIDELVVVNGASVAPNGDVISDPVPQIQLGSVQTVSSAAVSTIPLPSAVQDRFQGPPGTVLVLEGSGFNSYSALGNVAIFSSKTSGQTVLVPANIEENIDSSSQTLRVLVPLLPTGAATLTLHNQSTGDFSDPLEVIVTSPAPLSRPADELIDSFFGSFLAFVTTLPSTTPESQVNKQDIIAQATILRAAFEQLMTDPSPRAQQLITEVATIIDGSGVLATANSANRTNDAIVNRCLTPEEKRQLKLFSSIVGVIGAIGCGSFYTGVGAAVCGGAVALVVIIHQYDVDSSPEDCVQEPTSTPTPVPIPPPDSGGSPSNPSIRAGMGAVPPSGGPGAGNAPPPTANAMLRASGIQNDFFDFLPGRVVVKVLSSGFPIAFTGVTDAGGYFYIPLIPEGEPFVAKAIDTLTGQTRTFEGIGPPEGESVLMFFDFFSGDEELPSIRWDGGGDGSDWNDPLNWDTDTLPVATDRVLIDVPGNVTVTHAAGNTSIINLESQEALVLSGGTFSIDAQSEISGTFIMTNGTFTGFGKLTVKDDFRWSRGTINNAGVVAEGGLRMTGAVGNKEINSMLVNAGAGTWSDGTLTGSGVFSNTGSLTIDGDTTKTLTVNVNNAGTVQLRGSTGVRSGNSKILSNLPGGIFDFQSDVPFEWFGGGFPVFNNDGIVRKSAGVGTSILNAQFSGGNVEVETGTLSLQAGGNSTMSGGDFTVASGAVLDLTGGVAHTLVGNFTGTGDGAIELNSSTLNIGAEGATFNFSGELFQWTDGNIAGTGTLTNTGTVVIDGDVNKNLTVVFNNAGMVLLRGTAGVQSGNLAIFSNLSTGLFDFQSDASFIWFGGGFPTFENAGIVRKSAGVGTSILNATFSGGNVEVETGTLSLQSGGNSTMSSGVFTVASGAVLDLTGGVVHTLVGDFTGSGDGTIRLNSSTLNIGTEGVTFNFAGEMFQWTAGTLGGSGTLTNTGTMVVDGDVNKSLTVNVNNAGTVLLRGVAGIRTGNGKVFNNLSGGVFDFQSAAPFDHAFGGLPTFNNAGTVRKSTSAAVALLDAVISNSGTVDVQTGTLQLDKNGSSSGTIEIAGGQTLDINSTFENEAGGTIQGSGTLDVSGATFTNNGTIAPTVTVIE